MLKDRRFSKRYNVDLSGCVQFLGTKDIYPINVLDISRDGLKIKVPINFDVKMNDMILVHFKDTVAKLCSDIKASYCFLLRCKVLHIDTMDDFKYLGVSCADEKYYQYYDLIDMNVYCASLIDVSQKYNCL